MPGGGSADFNRGRTITELSELVREGRNLTLCARTSMGFTHDHDPTMMCDSSGRFFDVPPLTVGDHVRRRVDQKEPAWRIALHHRTTRPLTFALHLR